MFLWHFTVQKGYDSLAPTSPLCCMCPHNASARLMRTVIHWPSPSPLLHTCPKDNKRVPFSNGAWIHWAPVFCSLMRWVPQHVGGTVIKQRVLDELSRVQSDLQSDYSVERVVYKENITQYYNSLLYTVTLVWKVAISALLKPLPKWLKPNWKINSYTRRNVHNEISWHKHRFINS